jgi:hypothetical protein
MRWFQSKLRSSFILSAALLGVVFPGVSGSFAAQAVKKNSEKKPPERVAIAKTASGPYTILVDRVRWFTGLGISMAPSGFPPAPDKTFVQSEQKNTGNGIVGGTSGRMSGSNAGAFPQPNLILDVEVKTTKGDSPIFSAKKLGQSPGRQLVCLVNGKVQARDDQGRQAESPETPVWLRLSLPGVDYPQGSGRTAIHLAVPELKPQAHYLQSVDGELLVAEGTITNVAFKDTDLKKSAMKRAGGVSVRLDRFQQTRNGIDVTVAASPPFGAQTQNPMEGMLNMMASQGRISVALEDSKGGIHPVADSNKTTTLPNGTRVAAGGGGGSGMTSGGGAWGGPGGMMGQNTFESWPTQDFHFDPLPKGLKLKAIRCTVTDHTGPPQTVPFHLENIRLPEMNAR